VSQRSSRIRLACLSAAVIDAKFKSDLAFGYGAQAAILATGFLFMLAVTHYGSVAIYGALMLLVSGSSVLSNLISFRTNEALVAFYKRGESTGDWSMCKFAVVAGILVDTVVGCVLFALFYSCSDLIASGLLKDNYAGGEVALYGFVVLANALRSTPLAYLQSTERLKLANALSLIEHLLKLALVLWLAVRFSKVDLRLVIIAALVPAFMTVSAGYLLLAKSYFASFAAVTWRANGILLRDYMHFSLSTFTSSALKAGNQNIDTLILGYLTDTRTAGIYATFRQFLSPLAFLASPFEAIAYPRFVKAVALKRHAEVRSMIAGVNRKLFLAFMATVLVIVPIALIYAWITNLQLETTTYLAFCFMVATALLRGQFWWSRPFSNAINPNLSLAANSAAMLFLLIALYPATWIFGLLGTTIGMLGLAVLLALYWNHALIRHA
jgi:O-antigen/teichoic acid export membrane protein